MNNKVLVGIVVAAILIIAVGAIAMRSGNKSGTAPAQTQTAPASPQTQTDQQKSLRDLITAGQSVKCSFSDNTSEGIMYVSGGKTRGDFTTTAEGKVMATHMIVMDQTSYIWMDDQTSGFKMSFATAKPSAPPGKSQGLDPDKKMDYKCDPWTADSSMFTLPKDIKFTEMGAITAPGASAAGAGTQSDSQAKCAACNSAPAESKAQCLAALGCK